jgi:hypothetical protein
MFSRTQRNQHRSLTPLLDFVIEMPIRCGRTACTERSYIANSQEQGEILCFAVLFPILHIPVLDRDGSHMVG